MNFIIEGLGAPDFMQWFIDIINELIDIKCAANKVLIHSQLGFFDRGDPANDDFTLVNFTADNLWHPLDLSGIIPPDAKAVSIKLTIRATLAGQFAFLRRDGNVNDRNASYLRTQVAGEFFSTDCIVPLPPSRIIEYRFEPLGWTHINFCVKGWWLR